LVIIWLKRCLARSPIDPTLESAPVGAGGAAATGQGPSQLLEGLGDGLGVGVGSAQFSKHSLSAPCADAGDGCI
jgi:hypothetical protein